MLIQSYLWVKVGFLVAQMTRADAVLVREFGAWGSEFGHNSWSRIYKREYKEMVRFIIKKIILLHCISAFACNYSPARDACYRKLYQQKYYGACDANLILANLFKERAKEKSNDPAIDTAFDYFLVNCLQRLETQKRCDKKSNYTLEYNPP